MKTMSKRNNNVPFMCMIKLSESIFNTIIVWMPLSFTPFPPDINKNRRPKSLFLVDKDMFLTRTWVDF